jgi:hypothetical protein
MRLLSFVVLVLLFVDSAVMAQISKEERCRDNKKLLAELEEKALTLQAELSYTRSTEDWARDWLSEVNRAIADPEKKESIHFLHAHFDTIDERQKNIESLGLPWNNKYESDDLLFLRALREGLIRRIKRIDYVLKNKAELKARRLPSIAR